MSATLPPDQATPLPRRWVNPRLILIFALLLAAICASVIVTDHLSKRDRRANAPMPAAPQGAKP